MRRSCSLLGIVILGAGSCSTEPRAPSLSFRKQLIDPAFRSEGVTVFDVDRDGHLDLVTEELWYAGPDFSPREIRVPRAWDPVTEFASSFGAFHMDVDGDVYEDLVVFGFPGMPARWCRNPAGEDRHWDCYEIHPSVFGETPLITDRFGDRTSLLMGIQPPHTLGWMTPGAVPEQPWVMRPVTPDAFARAGELGHGAGLGDIDGDGRIDLLTGLGWFAQPVGTSEPWPYHAVDFCPNNCAHMFTHDLTGDGAADVIGTSPHNYGAWWWEQVVTPGQPSAFVRHGIDDTISQNHAASWIDLDGDDVPELVTGKRYWAHFDQDAGSLDPVVIVAYKHRLEAGELVWERVELDRGAGVGSHHLEVTDVDGDRRPDIVVATRSGLFLLLQD